MPKFSVDSREINDLLIGTSFVCTCARFSAKSFTPLPFTFYVQYKLQRLLVSIKGETSISDTCVMHRRVILEKRGVS